MHSLKLQNTTASTKASYPRCYTSSTNGFINFTIKTSAKNKQAAKMLTRIGLTLDGIIRDAVLVDGYAFGGAWF
jgi:RimJ/RimL family protein N-acetyltransferase